MKTIRVEQFGDSSALLVRDVPVPQPGPGQLLVQLEAAGVNPVDTYIRAGIYGPQYQTPYTPGFDGAGTVASAGSDSGQWHEGDRVYVAGSISGTYAEYALCQAEQVHRLPDNCSFEQGAALGVPYASAIYALLLRSPGKAGETVLIHGATGGVGIAAVQVAVAAGMTVLATGGTATGLDLVRREGAAYAFDHTLPDYREEILAVSCGRGPDVILEMLANVNLSHDLRMIAEGGRILIVGSRGEVTINPRDAMSRQASILGMTLLKATRDQLGLIHEGLGQGLRNGSLRPIIGQRFSLDQASLAHDAVIHAHRPGKIVLTI